MRRNFVLLLGCGLIGSWMIYAFLPEPKYPELQSAAECFHQLIEPYPPIATMCSDASTEELAPDQATYRLEVRLVSVPFGISTSNVPPLSGYLTNVHEFMEMVQGDVRCATLQFPACFISDAKPATMSSGSGSMHIQVKKTNDHFELKYTQASGITYTQEFELPEGVSFATNLGEHPVIPCRIRIGPPLPALLAFLNPLFTRTALNRREEFLLLRYFEIEAKE